ncbi:MAG: sodium:proton antiporter [Myxococcota bacterium]
MSLLDAIAILLVLAATFGFINHHVFKLPFAIGLLLSGLLASFGVIVVDALVPGWNLKEDVREAVLSLNFADTVLSGMLSVLLFAGALHTDLGGLRQWRRAIIMLASFGVLISTAVTGLVSWWLFGLFGLDVQLIWCLAFGALISPTDPIAVLGIMKSANAPKALETKVIGESLFNDGSGVVLFTLLCGVGLAMAEGGIGAAREAASVGSVAALLATEILGGIGLGLAGGYLSYRAFRTVDEANLEILITVATVFAISFLAPKLHVSAPLAAVAAGLFIGARGREGLSEHTTLAHDTVWTFLDETLNAVLFLLIGLVVFAIDLRPAYLYAAAAIVPAVLLARFAGVAIPVTALRLRQSIDRGTVGVLTWGGLKGGVSVALAMKLPAFEGRDAILTATYVVVIFSIVVQGLTVGPLIRRLFPPRVEMTGAA